MAAVQNNKGSYDYLIEWKYSKEDRMTPSTSLVKGAQFVFANPLKYRRFVEENYLDKLNDNKNKEPALYTK